jgi:hypothetical protein
MNKREQILLDYVIQKSYTDPEAQEVLNQYDAERTGQEYSSVALVNSLIRDGNIKLAERILQCMTGGDYKYET